MNPKIWMNMTLNKVSLVVGVNELQMSGLFISFTLPQSRRFSESIDGLLDPPHCVGLDSVHFYQDWRQRDQDNVLIMDVCMQEGTGDVHTCTCTRPQTVSLIVEPVCAV